MGNRSLRPIHNEQTALASHVSWMRRNQVLGKMVIEKVCFHTQALYSVPVAQRYGMEGNSLTESQAIGGRARLLANLLFALRRAEKQGPSAAADRPAKILPTEGGRCRRVSRLLPDA